MDSLSVTAEQNKEIPWSPQAAVGLLQAWHQAAKCYTFQSMWCPPKLQLPDSFTLVPATVLVRKEK